jgi:prepilin-type N-terminal cleavage/methylation domain
VLRWERGFTLIEVIVAMAILAVTSIAIFGSIYTSLDTDYSSTIMTEESIIAQNIVEGIKSGDITEAHIDDYPFNGRTYSVDITESGQTNGVSRYDIEVNLRDRNNNPYLLSFYYKPGVLSGGPGGGDDGGNPGGGGNNGGNPGNGGNNGGGEGDLPDDEDSLWAIIKRIVEYLLVILFIAAVVIYMAFEWGPITTLRRIAICLNELNAENQSITRQTLYDKLHSKYGFNPSRFFKWVWGLK